MCQTKSFCLRMVKFRRDHDKTHTNRGKNRKLLAELAQVQLLVDHWNMELQNMAKKLCQHNIVSQTKSFLSEDGEILYRSSPDTYQQRK
jgi:hypothetical protein